MHATLPPVGLMRTLACFALLIAVPAIARAADAPARRPNVLFIAVDDLRPELGAYGRDCIKSPNIDRLAARGRVFDRAYCQQAVCSPTRSSLMTGTRPDTTRVWDLVTHFRVALPDVVTLAQQFKNHGYFVQGMGKIYHGSLDDAASWSVPWGTPDAPVYALPENIALNARRYRVDPDGDNVAEPAKAKRKRNANPPVDTATVPDGMPTQKNIRGPAFEAADVPDDTFQDGKVAALAVETLQKIARQETPFFLAVGFIKPHLPFVAPKRYWDLYDPTKIELAANPFRAKDAPAYAVLPGGELRNYHGIPEGSVPPDLARQLKHGYYAAISYMDAQVGRVLDELDRLGLRDNTIVVLWGDHGWKLGEHDAWCKHSNTENDTNAPLIISAPGMNQPGAHSRSLVEFVDIYPTLCDLASLPRPVHLEGDSLAPLLRQPDHPFKQAAFSQYPRAASKAGRALMGYSMRTDRYRLTVWVDRNDHSVVDAIELYDHHTDPAENSNVADLPANNELVAKLLTQWKAGWKAARPSPGEIN